MLLNIKRILAVSVVLIASFASISCESRVSAVSAVEKIPNFVLQDQEGNDFDFHEITAGKVVVMNFWAERCPACKVEMPNLIALNDKYLDSGLIVIGIDVDGRGPDSMKNAVSSYGITYPLLSGDMRTIGRIINSLGGFRFIPTTYIVGRQGDIKDKVSGPRGMEYLENAVLELL